MYDWLPVFDRSLYAPLLHDYAGFHKRQKRVPKEVLRYRCTCRNVEAPFIGRTEVAIFHMKEIAVRGEVCVNLENARFCLNGKPSKSDDQRLFFRQ